MSFENKKKALFDSLDAVETSLNKTTPANDGSDYVRVRNEQKRKFVDKYKNRGSIFKKPNLPISRCLQTRRIPDYERNPERYKCYSLSDVSDMSDRMNSSAAFNFLREMEDRKMSEIEGDHPESSEQKIVFKNSKKLEPKEDPAETESEKRIRGNKFVMPEYVIGEKRAKGKKNKITLPSSSKQLKLSHLDDEEDE